MGSIEVVACAVQPHGLTRQILQNGCICGVRDPTGTHGTDVGQPFNKNSFVTLENLSNAIETDEFQVGFFASPSTRVPQVAWPCLFKIFPVRPTTSIICQRKRPKSKFCLRGTVLALKSVEDHMGKRLLAVLALGAALGLGTPALMADKGDKALKHQHGNKH